MEVFEVSHFFYTKFIQLSDNGDILPSKIPSGQNFDHQEKPYIDIFDTPNSVQRYPISAHTYRGIVTANVYYKKKHYGDLFGKSEASKIVDFFKDGSVFEADSNFDGITIYRPPVIGSYIDKEDGWWYNPVTIMYEFTNKR